MAYLASGELALTHLDSFDEPSAPAPARRSVDTTAWIERMLGATLVFNVLDVIFTLLVVLTGIAIEANPVMATVLAAGPVPFALAKIAVVSLGVLVLWRERNRRLATIGSISVFTIYSLLMVYHLQSIHLLLS